MAGATFTTQAWNRYSYVGNNPLVFTDPTGMCFLGCFWKPIIKSDIFKAVASIAIAISGQYYALPALESELTGMTTAAIAQDTTLSLVNAGISGAAAGAASTGTWQGALMGGLSAEANFGIGSALPAGSLVNIAAHGLESVASGGNFQSGFMAAGFSSAAGPLIQTDSVYLGAAEHAMLGGTVAVLGGRKFQNGAMTAAFAYTFNDLAHQWHGNQLVVSGSVACMGVSDAAYSQGIAEIGNLAAQFPNGSGISFNVHQYGSSFWNLFSSPDLTLIGLNPNSIQLDEALGECAAGAPSCDIATNRSGTSTVTHEAGHNIGMVHNPDVNSVMYPYSVPNRGTSPTQQDLQNLPH